MSAQRPGFRVPEQLLLPWSPRATVSAQHAAKLLDVSVWTVGRMCQSGELRGYKVREKRNSPWRVNYDSLVELVEKIHKDHGLETRF
jgi:excisionase family DNA binding protein